MLSHSLILLPKALGVLTALERDKRRLQTVQRALAKLESDPRHPGLHSHLYRGYKGPNGEQVWQSYVENRTPGAWRMWWFYGPNKDEITVLAIGPHPR